MTRLIPALLATTMLAAPAFAQSEQTAVQRDIEEQNIPAEAARAGDPPTETLETQGSESFQAQSGLTAGEAGQAYGEVGEAGQVTDDRSAYGTESSGIVGTGERSAQSSEQSNDAQESGGLPSGDLTTQQREAQQGGQNQQTGQSSQGGQQQGQDQQGQDQQAQSGQQGGCAALRQAAGVQIEDDQIATRDEVVSQLEDAGMQNVRVVNTAYLVEATSPNNECVRLIIDTANMPGDQQGSDQQGGSDQQAQQDGSQQDGSGSGSDQQAQQGSGSQSDMESSRMAVGDALDEAGFEDVRFLEAAYAVAGEMPSGQSVMLMVSSDAEGQLRQQEMGQSDAQGGQSGGSGSGSQQNQTGNQQGGGSQN